MNKSNRKIKLLFWLGILFVLVAPYFPSFLFFIINLYDFHFQEIRFQQIISSIRMCGVVLSAWGIALLYKKE